MEYARLNNKGDREINEDTVGVFRENNRMIFAVADGLGGHGGGEIASRNAIEAVKKTFENPEVNKTEVLLQDAFQNAHNALRKIQNDLGERSSFKTTLVILVVEDESIIWGHIGDSRIYHFEKGCLIERSMDHSVPQILVNSGKLSEKKIRYHEDRNKLIRVLGADDDSLKPFITQKEPRNKGAAFLICTDGFWEHIVEKDMEKTLKRSNTTRGWIGLMEKIVIKKGKGKNMDNYSAIAVFL